MNDSFAEMCKTGSLKQVQAAIAAGANVNEQDMHGGTPLMSATENSDPEVMSLLVKAGASVNARTTKGQTPLMIAAMNSQNREVVTTLLRLGADVNAKNHYGWTALLWAAQENPNPDVVAALVQSGADVKVPGLLAAAEKNKNKTVLELLRKASAK